MHQNTSHLGLLAALIIASPSLCLADDKPLTMSAATYSNPDVVASNIRAECDLPEYQTNVLKKSLQGVASSLTVTDDTAVPASGRFLLVRIESAVSAGNAFAGHLKQVVVSTKLYEEGVVVSSFTHSRNSRGGVGAGFKGSCEVLRRCSETLGKDIAKWVKENSKK